MICKWYLFFESYYVEKNKVKKGKKWRNCTRNRKNDKKIYIFCEILIKNDCIFALFLVY